MQDRMLNDVLKPGDEGDKINLMGRVRSRPETNGRRNRKIHLRLGENPKFLSTKINSCLITWIPFDCCNPAIRYRRIWQIRPPESGR